MKNLKSTHHKNTLEELAHRTTWGVIWAFISTSASKFISLVSIAILARILVPEDFGLMAFGLLVITYVETVGDLGTSMALIYWPSRRKEAAQVSFILNILMGTSWLILTWFAAPMVGGFFKNTSAVPILRVLAFYFPIKSLGNTHDALARKDLRFRVRLLPESGLAITKALFSIILAKLGYGVWGLVWGQLFGICIWTLLTWLIVDWRPDLSFPTDLLKPMLDYGKYIVGVNILAAVTHHIDFVIVGKMLGAAALGFYQIAYKLPETTIVLIIWTTGKVLFPAFSKVQKGKSALKDSYLAALRYVSLLSIPVAMGFLFLAEPIILTFFGESWTRSAPILKALGLATCFRSLGSHAGDLFKATGRTRILAGLGVFKTIILVPTLVIAAGSGSVAVATALAIAMAFTSTINIVVVCRLVKISYQHVIKALNTSFICSAFLAGALFLWTNLAVNMSPVLILAGGIIIGVVSYMLSLAWFAPDVFTKTLKILTGLDIRFIREKQPIVDKGFESNIPGNQLVLGGIGRFLVPTGNNLVVGYFLDHLFIPHNSLEKLWSYMFKTLTNRKLPISLFPFHLDIELPGRENNINQFSSPPSPNFIPVPGKVKKRLDSILPILQQVNLETLLPHNNPIDCNNPLGWLFLLDYPEIQRNRTIVFIFPRNHPSPFAIVKLRSVTSPGRKLSVEKDALLYVTGYLGEELGSTIPSMLNYKIHGNTEILVLGYLPGNTMDYQLARKPVSKKLLTYHFQCAATWLARFQIKTLKSYQVYQLANQEIEDINKLGNLSQSETEKILRFHETLQDLLSDKKLPFTAAHGDFWSRNLVVQTNNKPCLPGVVDWESFSKETVACLDLFHFPLEYVFNYSRAPYKKHSYQESFRRAFLEKTVISSCIDYYFSMYCNEGGLVSREMFKPLFCLFLLDRWRQTQGSVSAKEANNDYNKESIPWLDLFQMMMDSGQSVFSG